MAAGFVKLRRTTAAALVFGLLLLGLSGCGTLVPQTMTLRDAWPVDLARRVELTGVPFYPQEANLCGPAALATALRYSGVPIRPEALNEALYVPDRGGSLQVEMLAAGRRYGRVAYQLRPRLTDLLREVSADNPVVVLQSLGIGVAAKWHYAVVVGYDYARGDIYLRSGADERLVLPFTVFELTWAGSDYWAMIVTSPARVPVSATEYEYVRAVLAMSRVADAGATETAFRSLVARWPASITGSLMLAEQLATRGDHPGSLAVLDAAVKHVPNEAVLLNNLAQTLSDLGRNEEALQVILRIDVDSLSKTKLTPAVIDTRENVYRRLLLNA